MKKILIYIFFLFFSAVLYSNNASSNEKYELLDLFGQVFERVRSDYVEEVTDDELIEKGTKIDGSPYTDKLIFQTKDGNEIEIPKDIQEYAVKIWNEQKEKKKKKKKIKKKLWL